MADEENRPAKRVVRKTSTSMPATPAKTPVKKASAARKTAPADSPLTTTPAAVPEVPTTAAPTPVAAKPAALKKADVLPLAAAPVSAEERQRMIEEAAYYRAEKRGFAPGYEAEDWAAAEREIDARLADQQQ